MRAAAPPNSRLLGNDGACFHWVTPIDTDSWCKHLYMNQAIIFTPMVAAPPRPAAPPPIAPPRRDWFGLASSRACTFVGTMLALTLAILLGATLAGAPAPGNAIAYHDPGIYSSACLLLPLATLAALAATAALHLARGGGTIRRLTSRAPSRRQAKPGVTRGVTVAARTTPCISHPSRTPHPSSRTWTPAFTRERNYSLWLLVRAIAGFAPPWTVIFLTFQVVALYMTTLASTAVEYRISPRGLHRSLDPNLDFRTPPPRRYETTAEWLRPWRWHGRKCQHASIALFYLYLAALNRSNDAISSASHLARLIISITDMLLDILLTYLRDPRRAANDIHRSTRSAAASARPIVKATASAATFTAMSLVLLALAASTSFLSPVFQDTGAAPSTPNITLATPSAAAAVDTVSSAFYAAPPRPRGRRGYVKAAQRTGNGTARD